MVDVDGRAMIDCFLCNGPLLLGHRHPAVEQAVLHAVRSGSLVVNPPMAADLAAMIQSTVPCAERVRFLNSGTEAVMTAVRLARAHTGRDLIVKFLGHYHGQDDQFLTGLDPFGMPFGAGIPSVSHGATVLAPYSDLDAVEGILAGGNIAAVLLDPAMHAGGLWGSSSEYLRGLRDLTRRHGALLVFDEVITGFRLGPAGAQGHFGVTPDLATFAKALGAGEKLAAIAGRKQIFAGVDPGRSSGIRPVFQSGTGNDGASALAAGVAAVSTYRELAAQGRYELLFKHSCALAEGLRKAFAKAGIPAHVNQLGPMLQLFLTDRTPGFEAFATIPMEPLELFYLALITEGVLLSLPRSNHIYLSFAHGERDVRDILGAVDAVLGRYDFALLVRAASAG
ncbi:MAG: aminotransferase class III-fold pyridoxal phosphate-dependent enzyme [Proteobacteria bacterium]|nr:aminotransferase class III-fold pyridoxal phosphate-dependent enzyme [Pseudomonadota bacterium]